MQGMAQTLRNHIRSTITTTLILAAFIAEAQKVQTHQSLVWYANTTTIKLTDRWAVSFDVQERRFVGPGAQHQFLVRPTVIRDLGSGWDLGMGGCVFWQSPQDPLSTSTLVVPELRPHMELNQRQKLKYFRFNQRYKIEARFFHNVVDNELVEGYTFGNLRFRYRAGIDLPFIKSSGKGPERLTLRLNDEILINVGEKIVANTFDNNRAYIGLATNITPALGLEVGYLNWFQERSNGKDFYNRNILRIALSQKIDMARHARTPANDPPKG